MQVRTVINSPLPSQTPQPWRSQELELSAQEGRWQPAGLAGGDTSTLLTSMVGYDVGMDTAMT